MTAYCCTLEEAENGDATGSLCDSSKQGIIGKAVTRPADSAEPASIHIRQRCSFTHKLSWVSSEAKLGMMTLPAMYVKATDKACLGAIQPAQYSNQCYVVQVRVLPWNATSPLQTQAKLRNNKLSSTVYVYV